MQYANSKTSDPNITTVAAPRSHREIQGILQLFQMSVKGHSFQSENIAIDKSASVTPLGYSVNAFNL